jgi:hypothetical protein
MKRVALAAATPIVVFSLLYGLAVRPQRLAAESAEQRANVPTRDVVLAVLVAAGIRGLTATSVVTSPAADNAGRLEVTFDASVADLRRVLLHLDALPALHIRSVELAFQPGSRSLRARFEITDRM